MPCHTQRGAARIALRGLDSYRFPATILVLAERRVAKARPAEMRQIVLHRCDPAPAAIDLMRFGAFHAEFSSCVGER